MLVGKVAMMISKVVRVTLQSPSYTLPRCQCQFRYRERSLPQVSVSVMNNDFADFHHTLRLSFSSGDL